MGGTVRTVLNVANYLAEKGFDIEIISVFRRQGRPFFDIHPNIKITVVHDVYDRDNNAVGIRPFISKALMKIPSILIHKDEEAFEQFSLLTDLKLYLHLKNLTEGILVSTRPCFNLFVSKYANRNMVLVGQEHINFQSHPPKLKKSITKNYPRLNYLVTLTEKDNENYKKLFSNADLKVLKITNSVNKIDVGMSPLTEKTVITAGRLNWVKGYDLLIQAFSFVVQKHPDWKLKIFGTGRERNDLLKLIQEKKLYNNVFLMGPTKELQIELMQASIFVVSSRMEGFGLVIAEAMQCGVPVVSFDCPHGPSEIINNGEDGILVENGNIEKLGAAINKLIENKDLRIEMGKKAYRNVKRFSVDNIGKQWEKFFIGLGAKK